MKKWSKLNRELSKAQVNHIFNKLNIAEKSGFTSDTKDSILAQSKFLFNDTQVNHH